MHEDSKRSSDFFVLAALPLLLGIGSARFLRAIYGDELMLDGPGDFFAFDLGVGLILSVLFFYLLNKFYEQGSLVYLSSKSDNKNFLRRNKDGIILVIISALLGSIITRVIASL